MNAADIAILFVGIGSGAGCLVFAALLLRVPPNDPYAEPASDSAASATDPPVQNNFPARIRAWRSRLSDPTRLAIGASSAILGYHLAAWSTPRAWGLLCVPWQFSWLLIAGIILAVVGSLALDARDSADQSPEK